MNKKQTITYFIVAALPLAIHFLLETVGTILRRFNINVSFLSTCIVLSCVLCIANAALTYLGKEKFPQFSKLFFFIICALGLVAGFLGMITSVGGNESSPKEHYNVFQYIFNFMPIVCCILDGVVFFLLFKKFENHPVHPFLSLIVCFGLYLVGLPFTLLGYYVHFIFAGVIPFVLAVGAVIVAIKTAITIYFPKSSTYSGGGNNGGGDGKPKRYHHLPEPEHNDDGPDLHSIAGSIVSDARYRFGNGLSNVYPGRVDYDISGNTLEMTFHYSCKRNEYCYTPSDSDILSNARDAAETACRKNGASCRLSVSIYCDEVYTNI